MGHLPDAVMMRLILTKPSEAGAYGFMGTHRDDLPRFTCCDRPKRWARRALHRQHGAIKRLHELVDNELALTTGRVIIRGPMIHPQEWAKLVSVHVI